MDSTEYVGRFSETNRASLAAEGPDLNELLDPDNECPHGKLAFESCPDCSPIDELRAREARARVAAERYREMFEPAPAFTAPVKPPIPDDVPESIWI